MSNKADLKAGNKVVFTDCKYNQDQGIVGLIGTVEDYEYASALVISVFISGLVPKMHFSIASDVEVDLYLEH